MAGSANPNPGPGTGGDTFGRIERLMRRDLKLGGDIEITAETPFFGSNADIDSLDILLLLGSIEKEFGIKIPSEAVGREVFRNVGTLAAYVDQQRGGAGGSGGGGGGRLVAAEQADPLARLPHRDPFRFVSRLVEVKEGVSAKGVWSVTGQEPFFAGHFPGRPVVPGVLLAEALAQLSGLSGAWGGGAGAAGGVRLAHVDVRIEQAVVPPAEVVLESRFVRAVDTLRQYEVTATVGGAVVARGTLALSGAPPASR